MCLRGLLPVLRVLGYRNPSYQQSHDVTFVGDVAVAAVDGAADADAGSVVGDAFGSFVRSVTSIERTSCSCCCGYRAASCLIHWRQQRLRLPCLPESGDAGDC